MSVVKMRTHVVLADADCRAIKTGLERYPGYRVCICYDKDLKAINSELVDALTRMLSDLGYLGKDETGHLLGTAERERGFIFKPTERVKWHPIDFYHFDTALVDLFELFYREAYQGNEVIVNVGGGTKPVTIAATFATALTVGCAPVWFFSGEDYHIQPLFDLTGVLPSEREDVNLLLGLSDGPKRTIEEVLRNIDIIGGKKEIEDKKTEGKKSLIARYSYYLNKLTGRKLVDREKGKITLTPIGSLVARLLKKKQQVELDVKKL